MRVSTTFGKPLPERDNSSGRSSDVFRILVLADFGAIEPSSKPLAVDRDDVDALPNRLGAAIAIRGDAQLPDMDIPITDLDDFHPDHLFRQLPVFEALRLRRKRLDNDKTFAAEAKAILDSGEIPESGSTPESQPKDDISDASPDSGQVVGDLLGAAVQQTEAAQKPILDQIVDGGLNVDALAQQLVRPYVLKKSDPRKPEFLAAVDLTIAQTMNRLLHHAAFQRVERAWLGLKMLTRRLETDSTLQIQILHLPEADLRTDICGDDDLTKSRLYKMLVDETSTAGGEPWTVVVGDYIFGPDADSATLLGRLIQIHEAAGSVFISGAGSEVVGCSSFDQQSDPDDWTSLADEDAQRWDDVRSLTGARRVILAMPRVLARRPYGSESDPVDSFAFEELSDEPDHEDYLWLNAAFAVTTLLGQSFTEGGWEISSSWIPDLGNLPLHVYEEIGDSVVKPCAETALVLRAVERFAEAGVTAVLSVRDHDSVKIPSLVSLSKSQTGVTAAWS